MEYLHRRYYLPRGMKMRACHPRDILDQVVDLSKYQNRQATITRELLDAACRSYFVEDQVNSSELPSSPDEPAPRETRRVRQGSVN